MTDREVMRSTAATAKTEYPPPHDGAAYFAWHLAMMLDRALDELDLAYGELNKALGSHAPKAWDRIAAQLAASVSRTRGATGREGVGA